MQHIETLDQLDTKYVYLYRQFQNRLMDCYDTGMRADKITSFDAFYKTSVMDNLRKDVLAVSRDLQEAMEKYDRLTK